MAQWVNRLRNKIFVNLPPLPLLCEISGALHLAQPGLTSILSMVSIKTKKVIIYFISWSLLYMYIIQPHVTYLRHYVLIYLSLCLQSQQRELHDMGSSLPALARLR